MPIQSSMRRACFAGLIAVAVWLPDVAAQAPAAKTPEVAAPADSKTKAPADAKIKAPAIQAIPLEDVPDRAQAESAKLDALRPKEDLREKLARISAALDRALPDAEWRLTKSREALADRTTVHTLQLLEADLSEMQERLQPWDEWLDNQLTAIRAALQRLDKSAAVWAATAEAAKQKGAAGTTASRIADVRGEIDKVRSAVVARRNQVLAVRDRLVDPSNALAATIAQVQGASGARLHEILQVDQPPLWSPQVREALREEWTARGPQHFLQRLTEGGHYAREEWRLLGVQFALFVALFIGLRSLRDRAQAWTEDDYNLQDAKEVFGLPWAMALLISIMLTNPIHPLAPGGWSFVSGVLTAVAVVAIGRRLLIPANAPLIWGFVVLYVFDQARELLDAMPTLERIVFGLEMVGALGFLIWLLRPSRLATIPPELRQKPIHRLLRAALRVAAAALVLGIVGDIAGWGDLANMLGSGVQQGAYSGLFVFVLLKVVTSLAAFALVLWPLRLLRMISRHRSLVRGRIERLLTVLAVGLWVTFLFGQLGLLGPVVDGVGRTLAAGVSVGAFSVSLGDVVAFSVTVWLSFLLARLVDSVLQDDVFSRVRARRGVPYAIRGLVRYTLIFFGFLVALSAAGIELTKLTVIAGGLGVGIGFGLQNVVNNFVSGLILLFERPIQVGDSVQLADGWGTMKRIGIRASVIRLFDGAEIIVPNAKLISETVTNWTLSDERMRVELDVGVEYGTPAQRVIDLLLGVAKANPNVMPDPEPQAYFVNFGDSALEFKLRAWIESQDQGYATRSALAVAIQEALDQAGIGVPFPQRDLHLVSVSPDAASGLGTATRASPHPKLEKPAAPPSGKAPPAHSRRRAEPRPPPPKPPSDSDDKS